MLVSTPTKPYMHGNTPCDSGVAVSPTYHRRTCTPPRTTASYDSPMLPPSPLRQRPLFPINTNATDVQDDPLQSPYKSPALAHNFNPFAPKPQPITADDKDGSIFLSSASAMNVSFFSTSTSQPLLTPVKQVHRVYSRSALTSKSSNAVFGGTPAVPPADVASSARVGVGTKRKSTPLATPLRPSHVTPLKTTQSKRPDSSVSFECLAPLSAPRFTERTPQTKAETEAYLKSQTASLTRLRLSDLNTSVNDDSEFCGTASDSGCEMDEDEPDHSLFLSKPKPISKGAQQYPIVFQSVLKGKETEEVAEAVSPGGHVTKRRARSRPLSAELREQAFKVPKSPTRQTGIPFRAGVSRPRYSGPVTFPSAVNRGLPSPASSSDGGSPRPRRRVANLSHSNARPNAEHRPTNPPRAPLSRIDSAALFFGPAITAPPAQATRTRTSSSSNLSSSEHAQGTRQATQRSNAANRHSYAGPHSSAYDDGYDREFMWNTFQARGLSPSPGSSPSYPVLHQGHSRNASADMDDEDMFFTGVTAISPFVLNVTKDSASPSKPSLPMKYKSESLQRDHDASLISDEDDMASTGSSVGGGDLLIVMPKASTSLSSICSDEALVTPGVTPEGASGWPNAHVFVEDEDGGNAHNTHPYATEREDVDAFIMKALAAASKCTGMPKKAPGTPVKKPRMNYFGNARPWQSAVASKVGLKDDCDFKNGKAPRKSLPAVFSTTGGVNHREARDKFGDTDTEEEEYSPSTRRGKEGYSGLGLGMPPPPSELKNNSSVLPRNRWLMRRSSSGAFSSGSDSTSLSSTPTRAKGITVDWHLPKPGIPLHFSPSGDGDPLNKALSPRSASGSSTSSLTSPNSPTNSRRTSLAVGVPRLSADSRILSDSFGFGSAEDQQPGRFERDFDEIEEVGSGEFGKVIKVRSKINDDLQLYAIKKSKQFEGVKHRLRLREEVDILKHLSEAALTQYADGRHSNVLAYIDSWEEDEALFICTELCESGNLARFLWEYGRVFPRLDEARVWKAIVDLSNGLSFIHDSGVIHLDLKPSNVFVTKEGRFKIGDFGMASLWPRPERTSTATSTVSITSSSSGKVTTIAPIGGFEREGDKLYLAPEVLQGRYGKAADVFSLGMTILETTSNIVVPDQGEGWQRLRREDFSQVDLDEVSPELVDLIYNMMRTDPAKRLTVVEICAHQVVRRAREEMTWMEKELRRAGKSTWGASPLASVPDGFLERILGREEDGMDTGA
ncbi:hypothetical protein CPB84DRAFT_1710099 [Gymnopilus junonius]|uniref:Protein kinase domain-containing protein n=1 Tax=Gymnopilus junonius TaxID=109634 RepID=A0A9P5NL52_GYMJU|nr:hypothetical protein CPB84DRAFT_1710099 [Gymnopilus junonius]